MNEHVPLLIILFLPYTVVIHAVCMLLCKSYAQIPDRYPAKPAASAVCHGAIPHYQTPNV